MVLVSDYSNRMVGLYEKYLAHCKEAGIKPAPFKYFKRRVDEEAARLMAHAMANNVAPEDMSSALYVAMRVKDMPDVVTGTTTRQCSRCNEKVWVDATMLDKTEIAQAIVCNHCVKAMTGKSHLDIVEDELSKMEGSDV